MKGLFKPIYYGFFRRLFKLKFRRIQAGLNPSVPVYIVDIDNTLADTWPSLQELVHPNEQDRYRSLSVFLGMRKFILCKRKSAKVIFISARSFLSYQSTQEWLRSCGLDGCDLILVARAADKMYFIKTLISSGLKVVCVDDLSYNHEHGEMKLYHELIQELNELPLIYLGIKEIELINSYYGTNHPNTQTTCENLSDYCQH
ncbi:hypothetical protein SAMN05421820_103202 [Pedobacter steynii]|uniref:Uncharacterized protein n=1 Tax=Pedobacter steynii TaxID=430522 RepID=A0A1G9RCZ0_9SPHI|nr:hypothetical protein [Pedobacter steynii]NQX37798.1 hypothetical protein [Pedobacter steynii]SDM21031.1 hypothetical protein SAMN05421820_103202 [Pedobacter steynii]